MPAPEELNPQTPGAAPAAPAPAATTTETPPAAVFTPIHKGSGRYVVLDANGDQVGAFKGTKAEAEAEAARLAAGGEPLVAPAAPVHELADTAPAAAVQSGAIDPTTLKQAVLTSEGWLCPAPKQEG